MRGFLLALLAPLVSMGQIAGQVVPLAVRGPVVIASVRLNGQGPFRMIIDTGASSSSMLESIASRLKLKPEYRVLDVTPSKNEWLPGSRSVDVSIGDRLAPHVEFLWRASRGFEEAGLDVDGVLGQSLLSRFDYRIDYKARRLVIDDPEPNGSGARIPFTRVMDRMLLSAMNPIEGSLRLILDSAASNVYVWKIGRHTSYSRTASLITMNGQRSVDLFRMPVLVVGDQVLHRLDAVVAPPPDGEREEDGLLPGVLFRSIYVSNSESFVKLQR